MVHGPSAPAALAVRRYASLTLDQQPALRTILINLRAGQQVNVVSQQLLQIGLGPVRALVISASKPSSPTRKIESDMAAMLRATGGQLHAPQPARASAADQRTQPGAATPARERRQARLQASGRAGPPPVLYESAPLG
jgi:hypothetical protein